MEVAARSLGNMLHAFSRRLRVKAGGDLETLLLKQSTNVLLVSLAPVSGPWVSAHEPAWE